MQTKNDESDDESDDDDDDDDDDDLKKRMLLHMNVSRIFRNQSTILCVWVCIIIITVEKFTELNFEI